jgi:hypothetical protein
MALFKSFLLALQLSLLTSFNAWGNEFIYIWSQSVYSEAITTKKLQPLFRDLEARLGKRIIVIATADPEKAIEAIFRNQAHIFFWGYSDALNKRFFHRGMREVSSAKLDVSVYSYHSRQPLLNDHQSVAVLEGSTAYSVAKATLKNPLKTYSNYFLMLEALSAGEVKFMVSTPTFFPPLTDALRKRFFKVWTLPHAGKASVWINSAVINQDQKKIIQHYFSEQSSSFKAVLGTTEFQSQ